MTTPFEQQRASRQAQRLAEINGQSLPAHNSKPVEDTDALIREDEQKRAKFRAQREKLRQDRLDHLNGDNYPDMNAKQQGGPIVPQEPTTCKTLPKKTSSPPPVPVSELSVSGSMPWCPAPATSTPTIASSVPVTPTYLVEISSNEQPKKSDLPDVVGSKGSSCITTEASQVRPDLPAPVKRLGAQIKTDIGKLAGQITNSNLRGLVSQYIRLVSDFFKSDGDGHFPRGMFRHPTFPERCNSESFGDVLLFHIGRAVLAYYTIELGTHTQADLDSIRFLHELTVIGAGSHRVKGGVQRGYMLFAVDNHDRLLEG